MEGPPAGGISFRMIRPNSPLLRCKMLRLLLVLPNQAEVNFTLKHKERRTHVGPQPAHPHHKEGR